MFSTGRSFTVLLTLFQVLLHLATVVTSMKLPHFPYHYITAIMLPLVATKSNDFIAN